MRLSRETIEFIRSHRNQPFFAFLSFYAVHSPIQTTEQKWQKYRQKADAQGIASQGFAMGKMLPYRLHQDNPIYAGLVEQTDAAVGSVLDALEELQLAENTIVIFTSDNGGVIAGDNSSTTNAPLRGGKGFQWEGGLRVPYFIRVPWHDRAGQTTSVPVTGTDFYPTILELAGISLKPDQHSDGISLVDALRGQDTTAFAQRTLLWHYPHYSNQGGDPSSIIRQGKWKLIHYWEDDRDELYDLVSDPEESQNLALNNRTLSQKLRTQLLKKLDSLNVNYPAVDPQYDPDSAAYRYNYFKNITMSALEQRRLEYLSEKWQPNPSWWGSRPQ